MLALPAVVAPAPAPVKLWGEAAEHMMPAQVQALYPQAAPAPAARLGDGAVAQLAYVATLSTGPARVVFYFRGDELDAVLVQVLEVSAGAPAATVGAARSLRDTLAATYGAPDAQAEVDRDGLHSLNAQWTRRPLKVSLGYQDVGGRDPTLSVVFRAWSWNRHLPGRPRTFIKGAVRSRAQG